MLLAICAGWKGCLGHLWLDYVAEYGMRESARRGVQIWRSCCRYGGRTGGQSGKPLLRHANVGSNARAALRVVV